MMNLYKQKASRNTAQGPPPSTLVQMEEKTQADAPASGIEFDMMKAFDWKDGIATLPGSNIRFRVNEFGTLEIITDTEMDALQSTASTSNISDQSLANKLTMSTSEKDTKNAKPSEESVLPSPVLINLEEAPSVEVVSCQMCGVSGSIENFIEGKFCSKGCIHAQNSNSKSSPTEQKDLANAVKHCDDSDRPLKRIRKKRKLFMDSDDDEEENPEEEEEKSRSGKGRRGAKPNKQAVAPAKKKVWSWPAYLEEEKMVAAPVKLFKEHQSFPQSRNGFKVGMKLEGIDPCHPSLFCVLTVAEVQGYRIRLHFDGYPECYDFWVNADSWDLKPPGWCEKMGQKLLLPKSCKEGEFSWSTYVKNCRGQMAPKSLFKSLNSSVTPSGFRPGMKLEAVDKKNPSLICVATISAVVDNRLLIHFDNWEDTYDYWCDASSPYIHPVGFCQDNNLTLMAPPEYRDPKNFSWEKYLEETSSQPAPARAFKVRPHHGFQVNMKLEAVDKRNPVLIRVASVVGTDDHRLKIHFDGWSQEYDYWVDADSPDSHPVGWCTKTGHPLQTPNGPSDVPNLPGQGCPTPGCHGIGHIKGPRYGTHYTLVSCPYSEMNLNKEGLLQDRLSGEKPCVLSGSQKTKKTDGPAAVPAIQELVDGSPHSRNSWSIDSERSGRSSVQSLGESIEERLEGSCESTENGVNVKRSGHPPLCLKMQVVKQELGDGRGSLFSLPQALHESSYMPPFSSNPSHRIQMCWEQHCKLLPEVLGLTAKRVAKWSIEEVACFVEGLPGCKEHASIFRNEQIDGEAFLLLTQADIVKILSVKLGPALKIYNAILMFKNADEE
ncbi:lethal(3)malignant brain tumor-like protein 4 isoform X2 [Erpetoichthys calabaricus]|uniref:lethal(3)malignant brain tumor-like protein 4 isoform X2 n=1 Tax=Erpetoichthys calabaricus TaxID=27687 RepID=UPI002234E8BD|nr:lethal(3)malignant brain tumor-like protein 4 isoform X2 [Erpetoichthys calabaricus]